MPKAVEEDSLMEQLAKTFKSPSRFRLIRRWFRFFWQRRTRGWDDSETWSLDGEISRFIAPRLRRFKELNNGFPGGMTSEEWDGILDEMLWAFDFMSTDDSLFPDAAKYERASRGLALFAQHFRHLWW